MLKVGKCYKLIKEDGAGWPFYGLEIINQEHGAVHREHLGYLQLDECFLLLCVSSIDGGHRKMLKILFKGKMVLIFCSNQFINKFEEL